MRHFGRCNDITHFERCHDVLSHSQRINVQRHPTAKSFYLQTQSTDLNEFFTLIIPTFATLKLYYKTSSVNYEEKEEVKDSHIQ